MWRRDRRRLWRGGRRVRVVKVFVSYRRADTLFAAHAVGYALRLAGHDPFVDTGSIGGGELYPEAISMSVGEANVVLALIGPAFDVARLHDPRDVVAFEWRRARFHGCAVVPVLVDRSSFPDDADFPPDLRWVTKRNAYSLRPASLAGDVATLVDAIPSLSATPRRAARILWVDDRPANNEYERQVLRPHGIVFDNVVSTSEATEQLANDSYDLVITDLGRRDSSDQSEDAGVAFLRHPAVRRGGPAVIVYAGTWAVARRDELMGLGAADVMANRDQLIAAVLRALGRAEESPADLVR